MGRQLDMITDTQLYEVRFEARGPRARVLMTAFQKSGLSTYGEILAFEPMWKNGSSRRDVLASCIQSYGFGSEETDWRMRDDPWLGDYGYLARMDATFDLVAADNKADLGDLIEGLKLVLYVDAGPDYYTAEFAAVTGASVPTTLNMGLEEGPM